MNHDDPRDHPSVTERTEWGRSLRESSPRSCLAGWEPPAHRVDPVSILEAQNTSRVPMLVPIRHQRMLVSPFTFYRGGAAVMASDLATTRVTGLTALICGDAHLANFGLFGTPERALVFDLNDFDETHPGPWEWDVKRLAVSAVLMARDRGWDEAMQRELARITASSYREKLAEFADMGRLEVWYSRMTDQEVLAVAQDVKGQRVVEKQLAKARRNDVSRAVAKYTEVVDGKRTIIHQPPLVMRLSRTFTADEAARIHQMSTELFGQYLETIPDHLQQLVSGYEPLDVAMKVVGVGSVGTRCLIALASGRDENDLFLFQIKEADESVLAPYVDPVHYDNQGYRVVRGQHLMQAASDQFLGWAQVGGVDYYLRQFRDMKGSADLTTMLPASAGPYLELCGWTLARAHARSGDRIALASYLGTGDRFDRAIVEFSMAYADQVEEDYALFRDAAASGRIPTAPDPTV